MFVQYFNNTIIYFSSIRSNFLNFNYTWGNNYIVLYESPVTIIEAIVVFWIVKRAGDIYFWFKDLDKLIDDDIED